LRLTYPYQTDRLGAVRLFGVQRVFELDSGVASPSEADGLGWGTTVAHVPHSAIEDIEHRMAIVIPCKDERLKVMEGVLAGIPHHCLVILVSNSARGPVDRFMMEADSLSRFCRFTRRDAVIVHQRDPGLAAAFEKGGFSELLDDEGLVGNGKGEGMIVGTALAAAAGSDFVGFIDGDNYVPGAVNEYVRAFAADFSLATSRYAMVRISWHSKPKVVDGSLFYARWGRTTQVTNHFLNQLVAYQTGFGTEAIRTANAGEHALTIPLAGRLRFAGGFAVEPFELIDAFERYGGFGPVDSPEVMQEGLEVYQVETRNPHFHDDKGDEHIGEMRAAALDAILRSPACPPRLADEIREFAAREEISLEDESSQRVYPPLDGMEQGAFIDTLLAESQTLSQFHEAESPSPIAAAATQPAEE
jgi:mannosyl-3-phosphoglycerate synthase